MRKTILTLSLLAVFAAPTFAKVAPSKQTAPASTEATTTVARHGADDGPGHDAGDDRGNDGKGHRLAKHGADDGPGHDAGDDRGNDGKGHRIA